MKRIFTLLIIFSFFSSFSTSFAEENTETTTQPSTTEPSGESPSVPDQTATITFTYIDVDTNEEIAPNKPLTGTVGTRLPLEVRNIPGYSLSDVMLVNEVDILATDYTFPIRYVKVADSSESPISSEPESETGPTNNLTPSQQPNQGTVTSNPSADIENKTTLGSSTSELANQTSLSEAKTSPVTSPSSSSGKSLSPLQTAKANTSHKAAKTLPKAGNDSQLLLVFMGLLTVLSSLGSYWYLKKRLFVN